MMEQLGSYHINRCVCAYRPNGTCKVSFTFTSFVLCANMAAVIEKTQPTSTKTFLLQTTVVVNCTYDIEI